MKIGVLSLQGAFIEHIAILQKLGAEALPIRLPRELQGLDGLIIPGGESTTMLNLMQSYQLFKPLQEMASSGMPVLGTCSGMICLASVIFGNDMETMAVMNITVKRNAFGRQIDSFESELSIPVLGDSPFHAVFIRAPFIVDTDPQVEVLARLPTGIPVAARQGKILVSAFHPELTDDTRFHRYFLEIVTPG